MPWTDLNNSDKIIASGAKKKGCNSDEFSNSIITKLIVLFYFAWYKKMCLFFLQSMRAIKEIDQTILPCKKK
jgi:hypothetical protein